ncbi:hypothetical protein PIB30_077575 [Stylosanthes scabra]|uniref:Protein FAR1-RELATED SEQUENCE n=1 Tax=Stylosanthes scabra TaxID=79078 RepID=A0ABU6WQ97_9FABA|nr:hypothetical protein [Stylosanthes scabra]
MKKVPQKLNGFKGHVDIEQEMSQIVWSSLSIDIFERDWEAFLTNKNGVVMRRHTSIKSSYDAPVLEQRTKRYNGMISRSYISAEEASEFEVLTAKYHLGLDKLDAGMKEFKAKLKENLTIIHEDGSLSEINDLQSPPHVRSRGCPKKRLGSNTDKKIATATNRKKRKAL